MRPDVEPFAPLGTDPSEPRPRTRQEIADDRARLLEETKREIDHMVAEFHQRLPRGEAKSIGAAYARYSSRFQHSIIDQLRELFEAALKHGVFIPRENVCFDLATPGYKDQRPGLNRLRALLAAGGINVFLVFTTNRLFRKTYKALQFVEEEVVGRGIRCMFVKSGVDSDDTKRWRMLLQIHSMTDEFVVGMYTENIRSAHEGLCEGGQVFGTITFGYRGQEVPGRLTRRGRPRRVLEIDPETAPWVERAFTWFAVDHVSIHEIVHRFNNDPTAPPSPRSLGGRWWFRSIRYLLTNPRYRGLWQYGVTEAVWQGPKDYSRQVVRDEPLKSAQWEHMRIVSDALWFQAQHRLATTPKRSGRKPVDGDRASRPRLLNGIFRCPEHDRRLYVGGAHGQFMICKECQGLPKEQRPLFSQLNRKLALAQTCVALAALIQGDNGLVAQIVTACREQAERGQQPDPSQVVALRRRSEQIGGKIRFLMDNPGESDVDKRESAERLRAARRSRAEVDAQLARLDADRTRAIVIPSEEEVRTLLAETARLLETAALGDGGEDGGAAREIIELLTGGRIDLEQLGERKAHRGWLRGRFRAPLVSTLAARLTSVTSTDDDMSTEVVVDYRELTEAEALADRVKAQCDHGKLIKVVAAEVGISRNLASKALTHWYQRQGLGVPDGRSRRATLSKKHVKPPKYAALADEAKGLWDEGLLMEEIGERLGCDRTTLTRAIAHWHETRGLPVPDGRSRRKSLVRKCARPYPDRARRCTVDPPAA